MDAKSASGSPVPVPLSSDPLLLRHWDRIENNNTDSVLAPSPRNPCRRTHNHQPQGYFTEHTTPPPPDPGIELIRFNSVPSSIIEARKAAANILSACRTVLTTLELTRMRKARVGLQTWTVFWFRIYRTPLASLICGRVRETFPKVDKVFKITAGEVCDIITRIGKDISSASTEKEIESLLRHLEVQITRTVRLRQIRAQTLMETLRLKLEEIPVDVADELYDDMKRAIFGLDPVGNYHPGDSFAEQRDLRLDKPLDGGVYINRQPDLADRPGFTNEFQDALRRAAATGDEMYAGQADETTDGEDDENESSDTSMIYG